MFWQAKITDAGAANLRFCDQLEEVDLLGCNLGDGAIAALAGKPKLRRFKTGRNVTDDGLALLHQFPAFKTWQGEEPKFGLMSFSAEPTNLLIDGPLTRKGLNNLRGLDGVLGLSFFWHTKRLRGDDVATSHIIGMPNLKKYHAGYTLITDASLELLSRIKSLEEISLEGCKFITDAGIPFLTTLPRLREISIGGCPKVTRTGIEGFANGVHLNYDTR